MWLLNLTKSKRNGMFLQLTIYQPYSKRLKWHIYFTLSKANKITFSISNLNNPHDCHHKCRVSKPNRRKSHGCSCGWWDVTKIPHVLSQHCAKKLKHTEGFGDKIKTSLLLCSIVWKTILIVFFPGLVKTKKKRKTILQGSICPR